MRLPIAVVLVALLPLGAVAASPQIAVLDVQNMTCNLCPITVKKSLEKVPGVAQARIDFEKKTATVKSINAKQGESLAVDAVILELE